MSVKLKLSILVGTIILIAAAGLVWLLWPRTSVVVSTGQTLLPAQASPVVSATLSIENMAFVPVSFTVKKGTTVVWINQDDTSHSVIFDDGPQVGADEKVFGLGQSYALPFNEVGTFHYHCGLHPSMRGTIVVTL